MKFFLFFFKYIFLGFGIVLLPLGILGIVEDYRADLSIQFFLPFSILAFILAFVINIPYKKLKWIDDFFYLFFMTLLKRRKRKHRSLKQKMKEELKNEYSN